jgi:hypothetical protein
LSEINNKVPTQEEVELRAYEIYLRRGGENGSELDDWLAAEKELADSLQMDAQESSAREVLAPRARAAAS